MWMDTPSSTNGGTESSFDTASPLPLEAPSFHPIHPYRAWILITFTTGTVFRGGNLSRNNSLRVLTQRRSAAKPQPKLGGIFLFLFLLLLESLPQKGGRGGERGGGRCAFAKGILLKLHRFQRLHCEGCDRRRDVGHGHETVTGFSG